ncbi:hypothetical protein [Pseudotamlana agarivorans]|uniref:hypothetical protein n=1 Tax=Pseudotamlana agarivorans TaxID=481183 RepID=UPI000832B05B|nr:hypothetical protein [Tamlana agarivorans]
MKRLIPLILITFLAFSCSNDDDSYYHDYHLEYIGAVDANVPSEFVFGRTYRIEVTIELPNSCYFYYNQYDYFYEGTSRLIYPIAHVDDGVSCTEDIREVTFSIPVQALQQETYTFKFYQGQDSSGQDTFFTIDVPVVN